MSGRVPVGHIPPLEEFERVIILDGDGGYLQLPSLTTAQRNALTAVNGMKIYNSTTNQVESYENGSWVAEGNLALTTHTADLDAHTYEPLSVLRTGEYMPHSIIGGEFVNTAMVANRLYAMPFIVVRDLTVDRIALQVRVADAGKVARTGIYNNGTNLAPGTLIANSGGEVSVNAVAIVSTVINISFTKGIYWLAVVSDGVPQLAGLRNVTTILGQVSNQLGQWSAGWKVAHAYGVLPDPFGAGTLLENLYFIVGLRLASLD